MNKLTIALLFTIVLLSPQKIRAQNDAVALEMIGYTSASMIYTSHELMGKLHDGFEYECLEKEEVIRELDAQINLLDGAAAQYQKVLSSDWLQDDADAKSIREIRRCCLLLKKQADALKVLVESDYNDSPEKYNDLRTESWDLIKQILQIE